MKDGSAGLLLVQEEQTEISKNNDLVPETGKEHHKEIDYKDKEEIKKIEKEDAWVSKMGIGWGKIKLLQCAS